jgi:hypothetical protein
MGRRGPISSAEIIDLSAGIAGDIVDQLESKLALGPDPLIEAATDNARHLRDLLTSRRAAGRKSLEAFVRDHPVGAPYDPDKYDVEK